MNKKHVIKAAVRGQEVCGMEASGITDEDIRGKTYDVYTAKESQKYSPKDDWEKSEDALFSDLGF